MSYDSDLARLKRATKHSRRSQLDDLGCAVCGGKPAPFTRFGPRCERHRPADPPAGAR